MAGIIECVPNISEGRDLEKIDRIVDAARNIEGCSVLGVEPDADYNRTVVTIAGTPESVVNAAYNLIESAIENIDMEKHKGEHPRLGVVDVCPFIPLEGVEMDECTNYAQDLARRVADDFSVPTFLYGYSATHEERFLLSTLRKEQYEGFKNRLTNGETKHSENTRFPDFGPREWNSNVAKSGGITIGSRDILVAYNVNVNEKDARVSKVIGSMIRSSGRLIKRGEKRTRIPGMLSKVQGMGVTMETNEISQVSMNLLDVDSCPIHIAFEACKAIAGDHGIDLLGSELVGLVPLRVMTDAGKWFCDKVDESDENILVDCAIKGLGLEYLEPFIPSERIIEWALKGGE
jgi:glutamate formiminotransferase/formiminotetrahydrofolate cyclodeaminase